jgi:hypothetical protein
MRELPTKKGIDLSADSITKKMKEAFGQVTSKDGEFISTYPGIKEIRVKCEGKKLFIEVQNEDKPQNPEQILKVYNTFLESLTGLNAKERKKKLTKI